VAIFRPATRPTDLPDVGTARETGAYDFKGSADPTNQRELAKDVAAFANALGGVVLVGAVEDTSTRTLKEYKPMKRPFAEMLTTAYEQAVRDRCEPQPIFDAAAIELPPSLGIGFVVAVAVRPIALGPVGVRYDKPGDAFTFPLRTATHTHYMPPTELAMLMIPEIRRVAILIDQIPADERDGVWLYSYNRVSTAMREVRVVDVDPSSTSLNIALPVAGAETSAVPLDRVASVWRRGPKQWSIAVQGTFEQRGNSLGYVPF
jgi:hypothetical protein